MVKNSTRWIAGAALAGALALAAPEASAQGVLDGNSRHMGATLNLGGSFGTGLGAGRISPEFHLAFGGRGMTGPALGVGLDLFISGGIGLAPFGRFAWNFQPVSNLALFLTPYAGVSVGALFGGPSTVFLLGINFGGEVRFVFVDRVFLTVRPLGFTVPILVGDFGGAFFNWDGALGIGVTF